MREIEAGVKLFLKDQFSQGIEKSSSATKKFASTAMKAIKGVDKAFSGVGTALGALGVSFSVGGALQEVTSLNDKLTRVGLTADATKEQVNQLKDKIFDAAMTPDIKIDPSGIVDALNVVMTKTGDLSYSAANIQNIATAMQATGESGEAMGSVFAEFQKYGYTAEQISDLMDNLVKQGDQGAFTFGEFAKAGTAVLSAYAPIGTAPENIKKANAAMQILVAGTKNSEIAVTALESTMAELSDPTKQKKLAQMGIIVRDQATGEFRDFNDIMADCVNLSKEIGNTDFLGNVFGQTSMRAIRAYGEFYENMYPNLMDLGDVHGALANKSAEAASTLANNLTNLKTAFTSFINSGTIKPLEKITQLLNWMAEKPERFNILFGTIAAGIATIATAKGIIAVKNFAETLLNLKGGKIELGASAAGGNGMPVYVTNWGGTAGASPLPLVGSAGSVEIGKTPTGQRAGTPLSPGAGGTTVQKMSGAASQAWQSVTTSQKAMAGAAAGIGAAMVAIPQMVGELSAIKNDETLSSHDKTVQKGGAIGDAAGTVVGATVGGAAGIAAGAAAGAAIGSIIPGLGTIVGGLVGAGIGALGGYLGGKAGRAIGEGIGGAVAGKDDVPQIASSDLPESIKSGNEKEFSGNVLSGNAELNTRVTVEDNRITAVQTVSGNSTPFSINTGSTAVARSMF